MKVKFLKSIAGDRFAYDVDEIADVPDGDAVKWIASGVAEGLPGDPSTGSGPGGRQAAAIRPPERAVRPKVKFRRPGGSTGSPRGGR
jgi:hypothetical protein